MEAIVPSLIGDVFVMGLLQYKVRYVSPLTVKNRHLSVSQVLKLVIKNARVVTIKNSSRGNFVLKKEFKYKSAK